MHQLVVKNQIKTNTIHFTFFSSFLNWLLLYTYIILQLDIKNVLKILVG